MLQRPEYIITYTCKCALGTGYYYTKRKHGISIAYVSLSIRYCGQPRPQCRIERPILLRVYQYEARPETRHGLTLTATIQA